MVLLDKSGAAESVHLEQSLTWASNQPTGGGTGGGTGGTGGGTNPFGF
jgi:hypothetical protein